MQLLVFLKKLAIPHSDAGKEVFAGRLIAAGEVIGTTTAHLSYLTLVDRGY